MNEPSEFPELRKGLERLAQQEKRAAAGEPKHLCRTCVYGHVRVESPWNSDERIVVTHCRALGEGALGEDDEPKTAEDEAVEEHKAQHAPPAVAPLGPGWPISNRVVECLEWEKVQE